MDLKIIYEDNDILVIVKPVGILSENSPKGEKGIISYFETELNKNIFLLHRLDKDVGGVMVFAKNKKAASALSTDIANRNLQKYYLCITEGIPENRSGIYEDLLFKDSKKNKSFVVKRERKGVRKASLEYEVLKKLENKALIRVLLHTGRTHQIRVQFSSRKTPLCGDKKYGGRDEKFDKIALYSHKISLTHPTTKETMIFESEPDFNTYPWSIFGGEK